jgi:hypothetical protein
MHIAIYIYIYIVTVPASKKEREQHVKKDERVDTNLEWREYA